MTPFFPPLFPSFSLHLVYMLRIREYYTVCRFLLITLSSSWMTDVRLTFTTVITGIRNALISVKSSPLTHGGQQYRRPNLVNH